MNEHEAKQQEKKERYLELAEQHDAKAEARRAAASSILSVIPPGQPILVGHHSEGRHRRDLERSDTHQRKAREHQKKAEYYRNKAAGVGKGGISSDDPDAIAKLEEKLAKRQEAQEYMKKVNRLIRKKDQEKANEELAEMGLNDEQIASLREGDFAGRVGFAPYQLQNNNANIRRIKQRIEQLKKAAEREHQEVMYGEIKLVQNVDENRIQIIFPGIPSTQVRDLLKSNGFRWSRYNQAWQRKLTNNGIWAAKHVANKINDEYGGWE